MSKASEALREIGLINAYQVSAAAGKALGRTASIVLSRTAATGGLSAHCASWKVYSALFPVTSEGPYRNNGARVFYLTARREEQVIQDAQDWAARHYDVTEWEKIPGIPRTFFPAETAKFVKSLIKQRADLS